MATRDGELLDRLARTVDVDRAEEFVVAVAAGRLTEVPDIARELRKLYV